jgi:hypothetical protein
MCFWPFIIVCLWRKACVIANLHLHFCRSTIVHSTPIPAKAQPPVASSRGRPISNETGRYPGNVPSAAQAAHTAQAGEFCINLLYMFHWYCSDCKFSFVRLFPIFQHYLTKVEAANILTQGTLPSHRSHKHMGIIINRPVLGNHMQLGAMLVHTPPKARWLMPPLQAWEHPPTNIFQHRRRTARWTD